MAVEISTKGILPDFVVSPTSENLNGKVWDRLNSLTIKAELVQRLLKKGKQKERFFLLIDNKYSENGFRDPTRVRTLLLISPDPIVLGYVVRFHPIRHNPYFMLFGVTPKKATLKLALDSKYPVTPPSWWPKDAQNISIFNSSNALNIQANQASSRIFEFPHDADFESLIRLGGYKL